MPQVLVGACGIQFPDQGMNPGSLHWECRVLVIRPPGKSQVLSNFWMVNILNQLCNIMILHRSYIKIVLKLRKYHFAALEIYNTQTPHKQNGFPLFLMEFLLKTHG